MGGEWYVGVLPEVLTGAVGIIGYFLKRAHNELDRHREDLRMLRDQLAEHKLEDAKHFCTREELNKNVDEMKALLLRVLDKIEREKAPSGNRQTQG
jgi:uncharacterized coiled-coil DUF342 family protein